MAITPLSPASFASFHHAANTLKFGLLPQLENGQDHYTQLYLRVSLAFIKAVEQARALVHAAHSVTENWAMTEVTVLTGALSALRAKVEKSQASTCILPSSPFTTHLLQLVLAVRSPTHVKNGKSSGEVSSPHSPTSPALVYDHSLSSKDAFAAQYPYRLIDIDNPPDVSHYTLVKIFQVFTLAHREDFVFEGETYSSVLAALWENCHDKQALDVLRAKFTKEENKQLLLATLNAYLVVNIPEAFAKRWGPDTDNRLGRLLMQVRGELGGIGVVEKPAHKEPAPQKAAVTQIPPGKLVRLESSEGK